MRKRYGYLWARTGHIVDGSYHHIEDFAMTGRMRFVLLYFVSVPVIGGLGAYAAAMAYHSLTGRGGPDSAWLLVLGFIVTYLAVMATCWRAVLRRLKQ